MKHLMNKFFGKDTGIETLHGDEKAKGIIDKVNELISAVNSLATHQGEKQTDSAQASAPAVGQVAKIDLQSSKDPAHKAILSEDFKKVQEGSEAIAHPSYSAPVNPNQPTQQNVPSSLPGQPVPSPAEVAQAQLDVAKAQENGDDKNVVQATAEQLANNAK